MVTGRKTFHIKESIMQDLKLQDVELISGGGLQEDLRLPPREFPPPSPYPYPWAELE